MPLSWPFWSSKRNSLSLASGLVTASNIVVSPVLSPSSELAPEPAAPALKRATGADLPIEIVEQIVAYLVRPELVVLLRTSRPLQRLVAPRVYRRIALEFFVPFHRIQTLFQGLAAHPEHAQHVHTFLIDIGSDIGADRGATVQETVVSMFEAGFVNMTRLTVLSLPNKLNEAFAAVIGLTFPCLQRLEIKCDVPAVDFIARHARTLTHLVYPHHLFDAHELPEFPLLTHLHAAPAVLLHILQVPGTCRQLVYLGIVCSPPLLPASHTRLEDDSVACIPTIMRLLHKHSASPRAVSIREPRGLRNLSRALEEEDPLPSVTRLEIYSCADPEDDGLVRAENLVDALRVFPSVRMMRLASAFGFGKAMFGSMAPTNMVQGLHLRAPDLVVVVADYDYFARQPGSAKFYLDRRRLEMPKAWDLVTSNY
ncbi:hypothetical protein EXIGLDRAFT_774220 [Exidia glandulosa HHB12029]|uniref:F-box domain-containing protein n=1 Tax=Exidia glandulosa HHB12029 TaxID=1314781 RepID=A0A165EGH8_EXIGL|nr:hypothetical protein EXIGLDRAFT_774220 [Exidia glandulosa HHB12029]